MKKTILFACLTVLSACHRPIETIDGDAKLQEVLVEVEVPSPAAMVESKAVDAGPILNDISQTLARMNDTIENCLAPAAGLNFKTQTCEAPPSACQ